nr:NAD(P)H-dependent oxidoreductase [uncultured Carboxylicivirga sp.]
MRKILILFAHPLVKKSKVNKELIEAVGKMEGVTIHNLYEEYPDFYIDVKREQKLLKKHDIIIWQHPFYWYSAPSILKEWFDLVLEHGFAYGRWGNALKGKYAMSVVTTGGSKDAYSLEGSNRYPIRQYLIPFEQTARLCNMQYLPSMVFHGTYQMKNKEIEIAQMDYIKLLTLLRDEKQPINEINNKMFANEYN